MGRVWIIFSLIFVVFFSGFSSVSAANATPAKIVAGIVSNVMSALVRRLWSIKSPAKPTVSSRPLIKFEDGYVVETVFDGSKLGIEPYSVEVSPTGELLVLDSENSNIYKVSMPLSRYSRPKLLAGSSEGYTGHVDGRVREAKMNHPKGLAVDDKGNIYIADTINMAIRKVSDLGVTTIAGGKWARGGHVDGPSEDAKFSSDFDVVYIGSSCSLLVIDRGNQAIREIQLPDEDCSYQYDGSFHLGMAMLVAAAFFGYMLALLQYRVRAMFSSKENPRATMSNSMPMAPYQIPHKSVRPPLIPPEGEPEREEEGVFGSFGKLFVNAGSSVAALLGGPFSSSRTRSNYQKMPQQFYQAQNLSNMWPMQESFVIPHEDEPPAIENRAPVPHKAYPITNRELETTRHHFKQSQQYYGGWGGVPPQHMQRQQQQHHNKHYSSTPETYYEQSCESNEIVFGAVQEQDNSHQAMVIKAVDYADPKYNNHSIRSRYNDMGYSQGY